MNVVRQTVSKWEKGLSVPDADALSKIADILDTKVSVLLGGTIMGDADKDEVAEQLSKINEQLAIKNRRSKRIWKAIGFALLIVIVFNIIVVTLSIVYTVDVKSESKMETCYTEIIETGESE